MPSHSSALADTILGGAAGFALALALLASIRLWNRVTGRPVHLYTALLIIYAAPLIIGIAAAAGYVRAPGMRASRDTVAGVDARSANQGGMLPATGR